MKAKIIATMFRFLMTCLLLLTLATAANAATPYPSDSNTVLLDHFNGSTQGYNAGTLNFVNSLQGLDKAGDYTSSTYTIYTLPGWYQWSYNYDPNGKEGTAEMWVFPKKWEANLLSFQWYWSTTPPSAGYIGALSLTADGKLIWSSWTSIYCPPAICPPTDHLTGNTSIPLNRWTHVAVTWSPTSTKLYVNGDVDAELGYNLYPALNPTFYVYVNGWGQGQVGYVDELRISKVARTEFPTLIQPVAIDIKPGSLPNSINLKSHGKVPVAILGGSAFDVKTIVPGTVIFAGAAPVAKGQSFEDVNGDGHMDLVLHFQTDDLKLQLGDTKACLSGHTIHGEHLQGCDSVRIVK